MTPTRKKLLVIGDGTCGKTCLLTVFSKGSFPNDYVQTIHDVSTKIINAGGKEVELVLYDTAGQEDYDRLRSLTYPGTDVILLCFSITNPDSFNNVKSKWIKEVNHYARNVPIVLVGTKSDLKDSSEVLNEFPRSPVSDSEGHKLAHKIGAYKYMTCSAKENVGVQDVFTIATIASFEPRLTTKKTFCWCC